MWYVFLSDVPKFHCINWHCFSIVSLQAHYIFCWICLHSDTILTYSEGATEKTDPPVCDPALWPFTYTEAVWSTASKWRIILCPFHSLGIVKCLLYCILTLFTSCLTIPANQKQFLGSIHRRGAWKPCTIFLRMWWEACKRVWVYTKSYF